MAVTDPIDAGGSNHGHPSAESAPTRLIWISLAGGQPRSRAMWSVMRWTHTDCVAWGSGTPGCWTA